MSGVDERQTDDERQTLVRWIVRAAVTELLICDGDLLVSTTPPERSIAAVVARQITTKVPDGYQVDVEYHRLLDRVKQVTGDDDKMHPRHPDVIVHRRRQVGKDNNLLMIEFKSHRERGRQDADDLAKLDRCVDELGYKYAVAISLFERDPPSGFLGAPQAPAGRASRNVCRPHWQWRPGASKDTQIFSEPTLRRHLQAGIAHRALSGPYAVNLGSTGV